MAKWSAVRWRRLWSQPLVSSTPPRSVNRWVIGFSLIQVLLTLFRRSGGSYGESPSGRVVVGRSLRPPMGESVDAGTVDRGARPKEAGGTCRPRPTLLPSDHKALRPTFTAQSS